MADGTLILGFGHKARQGKDTAARLIHEAFPADTRLYSFAGALKAYCRVSFGMRQKDPRLLQIVGTDLLRARDPDIWVRILRDQIAEEAPRVALVTDVRFPNEAAAVDAAIRVRRLTPDGDPWVATDRDPRHPSETALDDWSSWAADLVVADGDLEDLRRQALAAYADVVGPRFPLWRAPAWLKEDGD